MPGTHQACTRHILRADTRRAPGTYQVPGTRQTRQTHARHTPDTRQTHLAPVWHPSGTRLAQARLTRNARRITLQRGATCGDCFGGRCCATIRSWRRGSRRRTLLAAASPQQATGRQATNQPGPPTAGLIYERVRVPGHRAGRRLNRRMRVPHVLCSSPIQARRRRAFFICAPRVLFESAGRFVRRRPQGGAQRPAASPFLP